MAAIVFIKIRNNHKGNPATRQIQLLGTNEVEDQGGVIEYSFPVSLMKVIRDTQIFAWLHTKVMFELSSKYSLALYEFLQKRKNLQFVKHETLSVEEKKAIFGVGKNELKSFGHFNDKALKEVSFLTEFEITAEPIRTGRAVTHIKFSWQKKTDVGAQISAVEELERNKAGRKARIDGEVEEVFAITSSQKGDHSEESVGHVRDFLPSFETHQPKLMISNSAIEVAKEISRKCGQRLDIYALEREFLEYAQKAKFNPDNADSAFINFVKKKEE